MGEIMLLRYLKLFSQLTDEPMTSPQIRRNKYEDMARSNRKNI